MVGLIIAIILFNTAAFLTVKRLTKSQILHMWTFTNVFQLLVDLYLGLKYQGYWYFNKGVEWPDLPALTLLGPPMILLFLNRFPIHASFLKRLFYIVLWSLLLVLYEAFTLLPEPWGYFHYGWWKLEYSVLSYPVLLLIVWSYYKWICRMEKTD